MGNPISTAYGWWKEHGPNPLITAALIGAVAYGKNRMLWGPSVETLRSLGRPLGRGVFGSGPEGDRLWNQAMDNLKNNSKARKVVPVIFGILAAGGAGWLFHNPNQENLGLLDWDAKRKPNFGAKSDVTPALDVTIPRSVNLPEDTDYDAWSRWSRGIGINKSASYLTGSYVNDIDWQRRLQMNQASDLFSGPQWDNDPYARNMGTAIVANAALANHTNAPTLGNVFDSAVNKIQNKMTLGGVADVALKSVVSNATAKMFTGALDAVVGLSPPMRQSLVDAGTWAGTISAILN